MNSNKVYTLNLEFCMLRIIADGTSVNTSIESNYIMLSIPKEAYIKVINDIEKDFNKIIDKYRSEFKFNPYE